MPRDGSKAHEKIIAAAFREFSERGFENASMRTIAAEVGLTVGALYRHFPGKEDMFAALVEPTVQELLQLFEQMRSEAMALLPKTEIREIWSEYGGDAELFMRFIYAHFREFKLLVCCSHGTKYESFAHDCAIMEEKSTRMFIDRGRKLGIQIEKVPDMELHLLVTANVSAVFEAVIHDFTEKEAMHYAKTLDVFFSAGWRKIFGI